MSAPSQVWKYDPELFKQQAQHLSVDNLRILRISKQYESECTETEKWYGTQHSAMNPLSDEWVRSWSAPRDANEEFGLVLFEKNELVAENLEFKELEPSIPNTQIVKEAVKDKDGEPIVFPGKFSIQPAADGESAGSVDPHNVFYFKQDSEFKLPKAVLAMGIFSPWTASSRTNMMKTELFAQCVAEELNTFAYDAEIAGLAYKMNADMRGLNLEIGGYDHKLNILLAAVAKKMSEMNSIPEKTWDMVHSRMERDLKINLKTRQPYQQAGTWKQRLM
jgi:insulysin